jgi:hypothetical protein
VQTPPAVTAIPVVVPSIEIAIDFEPSGALVPRPEPAPSRPRPGAHRGAPTAAPAQPDAFVLSAGTSQAPSSAASAEAPARAPRPGASASAGGGSRTPLPLDLPPLQATSSAGVGGGGASSLLLFGVAALTGFLVLAAPGLGRRLRLARYPRPRSRNGSSIDRPG